METRARTRTLLRRAGMAAALAALLVPAAAGPAAAKSKKHKPAAPVVTSISPRSLAIGETLTVRGHHFKRGRFKNTVVFKRSGRAAMFVKAAKSTTRMLKVTLPDRLEKSLLVRNGETVPTKLRLRVLSARLGKRFTSGSRAPMVFPPAPPANGPGGSNASKPDGDCDGDGQKNAVDTDDDNDLLPDNLEATLGTDPCNYDTDGDGVSDGYEYQSAVDLNDDEYQSPQSILPAPYKKPYPNALFKDADVDYDGDSLTLGDEFALWKAYRDPAKGLNDLVYSDGNQYSAYARDGAGHRPGSLVGADPEDKYRQFVSWAQGAGYWNVTVPVPDPLTRQLVSTPVQLDDFNFDGSASTAEARWYDFDRDGKLSDDERDEDADGLSNYDEAVGRMLPEFWKACYPKENVYPVTYAGTNLVDPDSDGDGVRDGADDQDHDDVPNLMELSRLAAATPSRTRQAGCGGEATPDPSPERGFVQPFNPCLPYTESRTCSRHPSFSNLPAPFEAKTPIYNVFN
jgi:ribosomal protein L31E